MTDSAVQAIDLGAVTSNCLNLENPKSFFLFAGAGSGKTRALVEAMQVFRKTYGRELQISARKVAVITYTNAACNEIKHRIDYDSTFAVSTIHSFAWELIQVHHKDIRKWLNHNLEMEINALQEKQRRGRAGKATDERTVQIASKERRLERLDSFKHFIYNPNGENIRKNSLNHSEVINIAANFLTVKPLMQKVLIRKYPVLLIDESQDTQKDLLDAFFAVQRAHSGEFCLALFGDTMQRIFSDGKAGLEKIIPAEWAKPVMTINYRCPKRIVKLINKIRSGVDDHVQQPKNDAAEGFVRLFLVQNDEGINKTTTETKIAQDMSEITLDDLWVGKSQNIKVLTLEHLMAARRGGFIDFFEPLYRIEKYKTGLLDGKLSGIPFFSQQVYPLVKSLMSDNKFIVAKIVKKYSPLVSSDILKTSNSSVEEILRADNAVKALFSLWNGDPEPSLLDALKNIAASNLFTIPDIFAPIVSRITSTKSASDSGEADDNNPDIDAWDNALSAPFSQLGFYMQYIADKSPFGTHQGIKGLQFERVMVILDDDEARGFMFSYDKLLGAKAPTLQDKKNAQEGKETSLDRTRRLLYVACSRAQDSLAIVVYTDDRDKIRNHLQTLDWFVDGEVIDI